MLSFQVYLPCYKRVQDTKLSIQKYMFAHIKILAWLVNVLINILRGTFCLHLYQWNLILLKKNLLVISHKSNCKEKQKEGGKDNFKLEKDIFIKIYLKAVLEFHQFFIAVTTNCHKLSSFKQHKCTILEFCESEVWHRSHQAKIKILAGQGFFVEAVGENSFPCLFQLLQAVCIPWALASFLPSSKPATSNLSWVCLGQLNLPLTTARQVFQF